VPGAVAGMAGCSDDVASSAGVGEGAAPPLPYGLPSGVSGGGRKAG